MATEVLAIGTTAANSSDIVVAAGTTLTLALKDAAGPTVASGGYVKLQLKGDAGEYWDVDALTPSRAALVVVGAGTYRVSRVAGGSCGVFRD
jgi:hypothetical protein